MNDQFRGDRRVGRLRLALWPAAGLVGAALAAPGAADARGFVAFGFGVPLGPPAYYPPPVYYAPPPAYYYPPPVDYAPPPAPAGAPDAGLTCREYHSTATIDGRPQPTYGKACLQPDGTWKIVE